MVIVGPWLSVAAVTISYFQTEPLAGWVIFALLDLADRSYGTVYQHLATEWAGTALSF